MRPFCLDSNLWDNASSHLQTTGIKNFGCMYDLNQVIDRFFLHDLNLSHTLWCSVHLISIFEPAVNINFEAASNKVFEAHLIEFSEIRMQLWDIFLYVYRFHFKYSIHIPRKSLLGGNLESLRTTILYAQNKG